MSLLGVGLWEPGILAGSQKIAPLPYLIDSPIQPVVSIHSIASPTGYTEHKTCQTGCGTCIREKRVTSVRCIKYLFYQLMSAYMYIDKVNKYVLNVKWCN